MALDFSPEELEEILSIFKEESDELIQNLNESLLALEHDPSNMELINKIFRDSHSIKGAAKMVGLEQIGMLAHKIEDIFNLARNGSLIIQSQHIDILCKSVDCIVKIIESLSLNTENFDNSYTNLILKTLEEVKVTSSAEQSQEAEASPISSAPSIPSFSAKQISVPPDHQPPSIKPNIQSVDLTLDEFSHLQSIFLQETGEKIVLLLNYCKTLKEGHYDIEIIYDSYKTIYSIEGGANILNNAPVEIIAKNIREIFEKAYKTNMPLATTQLQIVTDAIHQLRTIITTVGDNEELGAHLSQLAEEDNSQDVDLLTTHMEKLQQDPHNRSLLNTTLKYVTSSIQRYITQQDTLEYQVLQKIHQFLSDATEDKLALNADTILVINNNVHHVLQTLDNEHYTHFDYDPTLVIQQLNIMHQAATMIANNPELASEEMNQNNSPSYKNLDAKETIVLPDEDTTIASSQNMPSIKEEEGIKKTLVKKTKSVISPIGKMGESDVLNEVVSNQKIESYTIKTLRVDTKKLDQLVNQVGELIVAKIKAKETISEVENIIMNTEDWQRNWQQAKNSFKNIEKKPVKIESLSAGTSIYSQRKSFYEIVQDNSNHLNTIINKLQKLYQKVQDDDSKLSLLIDELEDKIKNVRLLPLATIFNMFPRMIRDIARDEKKEINIHILGSETTVDKKIIEEIKNPLIHIIRNAIDHGIETPAERQLLNKKESGTISIVAKQLENSVLIEITDDGRGINIHRIKEKIIEKDLLSSAELETMNESQILNVIFWPGFSTKDTVSEISGRGVGLDVVYTKISQLNGKISVLSDLGKGSKITIQLPVTMATLRVFIVQVQNQIFAIPASAIYNTSLYDQDKVFEKQGKHNILIDNSPIPINSLAELLEYTQRIRMPQVDKQQSSQFSKKVVVVLNVDNVKFAVIVDKLLGDQEVLHKNLSLPFIRVRNISGVTTLGAGEVCLILNPNDLFRTTQSKYGFEIIHSSTKTQTTSKKQVLVVDDSVTTRILERNILKAAGYDVTVAVNGLDALTKLTSKRFDLIVSDVEMPDINGIELTKRVKQNDSFKNIPIILVTSLASEADKRKGLDAGASAYITKGNFDQGELIGKVQQLIL